LDFEILKKQTLKPGNLKLETVFLQKTLLGESRRVGIAWEQVRDE
jgi:hypothetical protein